MRVQSENDYRILASFSRRVKIFYHVTIYFRCQMSPRSQFPFLSYLPISGFSLTSQHRYPSVSECHGTMQCCACSCYIPRRFIFCISLFLEALVGNYGFINENKFQGLR